MLTYQDVDLIANEHIDRRWRNVSLVFSFPRFESNSWTFTNVKSTLLVDPAGQKPNTLNPDLVK